MKFKLHHLAVLVPARDEEALLPDCLSAIRLARQKLPSFVTSDVVVVCDRSTDQTQKIAEKILGSTGAVVCIEAGCVGMARALAAKLALSRTDVPYKFVWLANTDADSVVPSDWLSRQIEIAATGFEAIAGIVDLSDSSNVDCELRARFLRSYPIEANGEHTHVHGANLGVRADIYLKAGGWAELALAEDHDLWSRLRNCGARLTSRSDLVVLTSGRIAGRAKDGFASALAAHKGAAA